MSNFNFEERCKNQIKPIPPLDSKKVLVEFLKHEPSIFVNIFKKRENIYKDILETILLEKAGESLLESFIEWYRDYLYNY